MPLITEQLPVEAVPVDASGLFGTRVSYYKSETLTWHEPVDGPDILLLDVVSWEPRS